MGQWLFRKDGLLNQANPRGLPPGGDPSVEKHRVVEIRLEPPDAVVLKLQLLRCVEGRLLEVVGGHGVRKFQNEMDSLTVAVVEVTVLHVPVKFKVLRSVRGKVEDPRTRHAVKRQMANVVVAVEAADEIETMGLLHESERRNDGIPLLIDRVDVVNLNFGIAVEGFAHCVKDARQDVGREHRNTVRDEGHLFEPGRHLLSRAVLLERAPRLLEERLERANERGGKLVLQVFFGEAQKKALLGAQVRHREIRRGNPLPIAVRFRARVALDVKAVFLADLLEKALEPAPRHADARLRETRFEFGRRNPAVPRNALQDFEDEQSPAYGGVGVGFDVRHGRFPRIDPSDIVPTATHAIAGFQGRAGSDRTVRVVD